jgi:hypothetical protein
MRSKSIAERAVENGIPVTRTFGPSQVIVDQSGVSIELNNFASRTATIEEYLQARTAQNALSRGESLSTLNNSETILLDEIRTKTRLIGAAEHNYFGGSQLPVNTKGLYETLNEYRVQYEFLKQTKP